MKMARMGLATLSLAVLTWPIAALAEEPVTKVVALLKELKTEIEEDGKTEQAAYDKYACWCETTTAKSAYAIKKARKDLEDLGRTILELKGSIASMIEEIKQLLKDIRENEEAQQEATSIRQKEHEAFTAEQTELQQAIAALEKATGILASATTPALMQSQANTSRWAAALEGASAAASMVAAKLPAGKRSETQKQLSALAEAAQRYTPQSATIQGILQEMYHTFASNLESRLRDEAAASHSYEALMATYQEELATLQKSAAKKEQAKTESEIILADATQSYTDTEAQLHDDVALFDATKASCEAKTSDWSKRKALRIEEVQGISQALEILTSDEAKELFVKANKPGIAPSSFVQLKARSVSAPAARASRVLQSHARVSGSLRLASLSAKLRSGGHFDEVLKAIDMLMVELKEEADKDTQQADECQNKTQNFASSKADLEWKIETSKARLEKLQEALDKLDGEKTSTTQEMLDLTAQVNAMQKQREEENSQFHAEKTDDEKAVELLKQAKSALVQYFEKNKIELGPIQGLLHAVKKAEPTAEEPELKFSGKDKRKHESKGIISLLTLIIEDLEGEISGGIKSEAAAHEDFETRMAAAQSLNETLTTKFINLEQAIAQQSIEKESEDKSLGNVEAELEGLEQEALAIKPFCDWLLGALDTRREKRKTEMDGLRTAREYLAGAVPTSLLQASGRTPSAARQVSVHKPSIDSIRS